MQNYSENWQHLKSILDGYARKHIRRENFSYDDHVHAKALSIFLAHATLATLKLDRLTVEDILAGRLTWPNHLKEPSFDGVDLQLSILEECGLVAFYADWCSVHCRSPRNSEDVDQSVVPLIQAVEHLKDISYGRDGYIQPHYICPKAFFDELWNDHFGSSSIGDIIPELILESNHYSLPPGNQSFSSLVSTYLWHALCKKYESQEAFACWILCMRVNCEWAFPVLFDDTEFEEKKEFNNQLLAYVEKDACFFISSDILLRQSINGENFSYVVAPVSTKINIAMNVYDNSSSENYETIELEKPTLDSLITTYPREIDDKLCDLEFVINWWKYRHSQEPEHFYTYLLNYSIETNVRIEGQLLASYEFVEKLLELTASRPLLKYLVFNKIPDYENVKLLLFLLSSSATCDISLFYLSQRSFSSFQHNGLEFTKHFDKGYQQLVCHEYFRAISKEVESGIRLLKVVQFLGERCDLRGRDFGKNHGYQFLLCFLEGLSHQHVIQLGKALSLSGEETQKESASQSRQHYLYFLGFWLIERLEHIGNDPSGELTNTLKTHLLDYYKTEFEKNLDGVQRDLEPSYFFSILPWHKLIGDKSVSRILSLSQHCCDWKGKLSYSNEKKCFGAASAVRHYLQVLMLIGRPQIISQNWKRIANRVVELVRILGFGPREEAIYLFNAGFYSDKFDLWSNFCSYANLLEDELYDDFVERCLDFIPLNQLFVLFESCTVIARARKLQEVIASQQLLDSESLGLSDLEQAFISAWDAGHNDLASKLIDRAKELLSQERFSSAKNPSFLKVRKSWLVYEYKWQLLKLLEDFKNRPDDYDKAARQVPIPIGFEGQSRTEEDRRYRRDCEHFRRYIVAAAYCEKNPTKCIGIMEHLCKESDSSNFSFMLFRGKLALYEIDSNITGLRSALSQLLERIGGVEPASMPTLWVAVILDAYQKLQDHPGIDTFWRKLDSDQQARREIMHPYCRSLIKRGDALIAQQIITRYRELNLKASDDLGINELIDELGKALPNELPLSQMIQMVNEDSQRSVVQLRKHYSQIVTKEFVDYVDIVGQGLSLHEFLKNAVLEVAQELLLRRKNLQLHIQTSSCKDNIRITQEDLINDWFTSLFDKRLADARIGMRDQKRGGSSASGKSPGEIDGYITDSKNKRISIFEAFRLFSLNTNVIVEHLNKISGYDNESLSPVFIVAYCDVNNFCKLTEDYSSFIAAQSYTGFIVNSSSLGSIETLESSDNLWLGMERRFRNDKEIIFYHLLINMQFED
jgi:hypothetical protein